MFGRRKQVNENRQEKKKWRLELEEKSLKSSNGQVSVCGSSSHVLTDSSGKDGSVAEEKIDANETSKKISSSAKVSEESTSELVIELSEQDLKRLEEEERERERKDKEEQELEEERLKQEKIREEKAKEEEEKKKKTELGKRKRYAWMDSDDEDISSEELEDEEEEISQEAEEETSGGPPGAEALNSYNNNANAIGANSSSNNGVQSIEKDDNIIYESVRFAFITNIPWEVSMTDIKMQIQNITNQKVLSITAEHSSTSYIHSSSSSSFSSSSSSSKTPSNKQIIPHSKSNEYGHSGRVYVEFISYQALQSVLKLNETNFIGRVIKVLKAYRRNNQFYLLQTPAHFKFFHSMMSGRNLKKKVHKVDGGFNWAK